MKILILGKDGQLGQALQEYLATFASSQYLEILALGHEGAGNLADPTTLAETVRNFHPGILFNAAAYTNVEAAENPEGRREAFLVNAEAVKTLASSCEKCSALLVHYSTDYVFDGKKKEAYLETDTPHPINAYGESKLAGEATLAISPCQSLIFRTSWLYSPKGRNFVSAILKKALRGDPISVVADQRGVPTSARFLAEISARIAFKARSGSLPKAQRHCRIIHAVPRGSTTWFDFAKFILTKAEAIGFPVKTRASDIRPITTADYPCKAIRPKNSRLDNRRMAGWLLAVPVSWEADVEAILQEITESLGK